MSEPEGAALVAIQVPVDMVPVLAEFIEHYAPGDNATDALLDVARRLQEQAARSGEERAS